MVDKPSFEIVYEYAKNSVGHYIKKFARSLSDDQKEEISQEAMLRVWQAYQNLDDSGLWKSFVQTHCRGACLDYVKGGKADIESELTGNEPKDKSKFEKETVTLRYKQTLVSDLGLKTQDVTITREQVKANHSRQAIKAKRVEIFSDTESDQVLSIDDTCAMFGIHQDNIDLKPDLFAPKWDLLGRLAGQDDDLHIVAKVLLGFSQEQIADQYSSQFGLTISRERISQRIYEMFERFDSPQHLNNKKIKQSIYALGLNKYYFEPEIDYGIGWDLQYFDLTDKYSFKKARKFYTPTFFDLYPAESRPDGIAL